MKIIFYFEIIFKSDLLLYLVVIRLAVHTVDRCRELLDPVNSLHNLRAVVLGVLTDIVHGTADVLYLINVLHDL